MKRVVFAVAFAALALSIQAIPPGTDDEIEEQNLDDDYRLNEMVDREEKMLEQLEKIEHT